MKKRIFSLLLALALLLAGCNLLPDAGARPRELSESSIWAMDTQMDLRLYGDTDGTVMTELTATLNRLDRTLSATAADSALTALNESGWTDDKDIVYLAANARRISEQTAGALDITLLPVSRLWGFPTDSCGVPAAGELEALRDNVGMDKLTLTDESVSVPAGTKLDFGALAKGYAADLCRARMEEAGVSGILALGGNIQTVGTKPDGSDWIIGVQDPNDTGRYILTLRLSGAKAVVSSGDYQRYFMQDGVRYCHILDPETLAPVRGSLRSVTVVAEEGLLADGLSTALYVLGREAGTELWRQRGDFEALWIEDDGSVWVTPGLKDRVAEGDFRVIEP
ncbi:MAG: FAD:protein FMN transferase [Oscillospiraceae bacterium]|nr:FAD:protein FMN transferase [Oscillospiraceae bacterium]